MRKAKRKFWHQVIEEVKDSAGIYKLARWAKRESPFQPPPLQIGGEVFETQLQKAEALRHSILERRGEEDDIEDAWIPLVSLRSLSLNLTVSLDQARQAAIPTGSTTPGIDGITVRTLQLAWESVGKHIQRLCSASLELGYYPKIFQQAEILMMPKPGKRDLTTPRSWRPISLLSCLGKGLERLLARRLAWTAIQSEVLQDQQWGIAKKVSS